MKVLVTGGAGFIGSHVVDQLVAAGASVMVLDALSGSAQREPPDYVNRNADLVVADIGDAPVLRKVVGGVDAVAHLAARVGLERGIVDAPAYVSDNDSGTSALLVALAERSFRGRLVLASSMVVYGEGSYACATHGRVRPLPRALDDLRAGFFDARCPDCSATVEPVDVTEDEPVDPRNIYAATKLHQEHLCATYGREFGISITALRYHNVYGARMPRDTPYAGVAAIFASALASGEPPRVFEDGAQRRDFIHVADVARATVMALSGPVAFNGALNIASGQPRTVLDMAGSLSRAAGEADLKPVVTGEFRTGDVRHIVASPGRARDVLGFEASIGFDNGMIEFRRARQVPAG